MGLMSGFFVEAGAFDGATDSTSLHFEMAHKWSGLLVEPVSRLYISTNTSPFLTNGPVFLLSQSRG